MSIFLPNQAPQAEVQQPTIVAQRDPGDGDIYPIGQFWINVTSDEIFTLTSFSNGLPFWQTAMSGGGTFTSILVTPGPSQFEGVFEVLGNIDQPEVIKITEDGGTTGSITIESLQGTAADAINIHAVSGGIEVVTDATAADITVTANDGSVNIVSGEDAADAILIGVGGGVLATMSFQNLSGTNNASNIATASVQIQSGAGGVGIEAAKDFNILADDTSIIEVTTGDLNLITDVGKLIVTSAGGIDYNITGAIELDATLDSHFTVTGAGADLLLSSVGGRVTVDGSQAAVNAVRLDASDVAGGIDVDAGTGGITIDTTGAFSIDGAAASNVTTTGAAIDLTLSSVLGSVNVLASESAVNAIRVNASDAAGGIDIDCGTGGITIDSTGAFSIDGAAASNVTATGAAIDLTLSSVLGSVNVLASQAAVDAVRIFASDAAGGIDIDCGTGGATLDTTGAFSIDGAANSNVTLTGAFDLSVNSTAGDVIITGGRAAVNAVQVTSSNAAGGLDLNAGTGGITIDSTGLMSFDSAGVTNLTATGAFDVTVNSTAGSVIVTGGEAAVDAVQINASNGAGGVDINVGTGGITIDTTGAMSFDSAAASNLTVTGAFDLTVSSSAGSVVITGGEAAVDAITITAGNAAGGLDLNAGTGGITLDTTGAMSFDSAAASNMTVTGAFDLTVNSTAGSVIITGGEAVADAVQISASHASGGVIITGGTAGNVEIINAQAAATAGPSPTVAVTSSVRVGSITFSGYTQAAAATLVVTLTNSFIATTSAILATVTNVGANDAQMYVKRIKPAAGSAEITILNGGAAALNGDMLLTFWVLS